MVFLDLTYNQELGGFAVKIKIFVVAAILLLLFNFVSINTFGNKMNLLIKYLYSY